MTDQERTPEGDGCGADVAAYALGALSSSEAAAFEEHLAGCATCRQELTSFRHVVDAMPLTAQPQRAPRALRRRVLRAVEQDARAAKPPRSGVRAFLSGTATRPALVGAGLLAAAVIAVGGVELAGSGSDARVYQAQVTGQGSAELTVSGTHAELAVRHFSAPPKGHIYEVWLKRAGAAPVPANALFDVTAAGDSEVHLPVNVRSGDQILVTAEPAGGSGRAPTTTPVISVALS